MPRKINKSTIPFLDLKREWLFFEKTFLKAVKKFGRDGVYVLGSCLEKFEEEFADFCGYKYAIGVSSGLSALEIALLAHGVKAGDEVITAGNSAVATSLAISNIGAKPIFCDVKNNFLIDEKKITELITDKTKAILPVHLFGNPCNMKLINMIAREHRLEVIEDACQAHGVDFKDESKTNTKAFSFYPTKNLGCIGEGGIIITNNEEIRNFAASYRNYGQNGRYNHEIKGNNHRLDPIQCVFLSIKLKKLKNFIRRRKIIAKRYFQAFKNIKGIEMGGYDEQSSFHLFVIRIKNGRRGELMKYLENKKIKVAVHYPVAIYKQLCYRKEYGDVDLQNTEELQKGILSLPCYPFLKPEEQDIIIKEINNFFKSE